ncbi:MAG: peptidoglycan DD-metalloendopeptidase family protein [Algicola sp.]|nr:peptidoglycan DD-metalloendopeptidase family protein [Algicola sp.]
MQQLLNQLPKRHKIFITSLLTLVVLLMFIPAEKANASRDNSIKTLIAIDTDDNVLEVGKSYPLEVDLTHIEESIQNPKNAQSLRWQKVKVKNGDNLAKIFKRAGFSAQTLHKITSLGKSTKILTKIHPGETVSFGATKQGILRELTYSLDQVSTLIVSLNEQNKYQTRTDTKEVETRRQFATAVINSNFWNAGIESGLNNSQIMNLANIFGWDIDFALDIRDGDAFSVVYEDRYIDGEYVGTGNIISAEFVNQGDNYQAVRYTDGEYYSPEGRSMRKAFLRAPVNFKYVSSSFKRRRFHPVQKRWKAHRGVDYAAKTGTPVVAAGNGKVIRSSYSRANGNHVFIQHPNGIVTKYLHFSKRKVKKGTRVKQGQLIGLVGSTGLSSGPHLHFEFIVNGVHRNPRTVKMPKAKPIAKKEKSRFLQVAITSMAELNAGKRVRLAFRDNNKSPK